MSKGKALEKFNEMVGKTIVSVKKMQPKEYDDCGFLRIGFKDGSHIIIESFYGDYTGKSVGEYQTFIGITSRGDLIKLKNTH